MVPIVVSRREEAIDISLAQIRAEREKFCLKRTDTVRLRWTRLLLSLLLIFYYQRVFMKVSLYELNLTISHANHFDIECHYCVMHTRNRTPLPLAQAFKRFFHILSTGMLLPTSPALVDPCDPAVRINYSLSLDDMDNICSTAQTLLRVIWHGGAEAVLGMDAKAVTNVASELTVWNNVVVTPLEKAYSAEEMEPYYGDDIKMEDASGDQTVPAQV
ncbi:DZF domain-containing protein [Ditylenchus destructor]|uniref:DZF domain-containing protein n=1 Tax=Ditylenchus destructor TaxID=166010 RepID=A0AAD4N4L1_9BILA|nr:DZF domain-containing protein [Ditylenchus destructor]